jgi:hypothetical protein
VLCRGRAWATVWRRAALLAGGVRRGGELLTRYGSEHTAWRCPARGCGAAFFG